MISRIRASIAALFFFTATLSACGGTPDWVRPGQDAAANSRDYDDCRGEAQLTVWNRTQSMAPFPTPGVTPMDDPGLIGQPRGYPYGRNDPTYRLQLDRAMAEGPAIRQKALGECLAAKGFTPAPD